MKLVQFASLSLSMAMTLIAVAGFSQQAPDIKSPTCDTQVSIVTVMPIPGTYNKIGQPGIVENWFASTKGKPRPGRGNERLVYDAVKIIEDKGYNLQAIFSQDQDLTTAKVGDLFLKFFLACAADSTPFCVPNVQIYQAQALENGSIESKLIYRNTSIGIVEGGSGYKAAFNAVKLGAAALRKCSK